MTDNSLFSGTNRVLEAATLSIDPDRVDEFVASAGEAIKVIVDQPNAYGADLIRSVENPAEFLLLVVWESVQAHQDFRASDDFPLYRGHIQDYFAALPAVTHYTWIAANSGAFA